MTIDWDLWRARYDSLTFADQQEFYAAVAEAHPAQAHFQLPVVQAAFDHIAGSDLRVIEMGGWDGQLAAAMLERGDIALWTNFDLVQPAQACSHPRYSFVLLGGYLWDHDEISADVFVATHVIEHITGAQLRQLVGKLDVSHVYLESPLPISERCSWFGYPGSHILELTWLEVEALLAEHGYEWAGVPNLWQR